MSINDPHAARGTSSALLARMPGLWIVVALIACGVGLAFAFARIGQTPPGPRGDRK